MKLPLASTVVVVSLAVAASASANGRFPEANQIATSPAKPDVLVVRASFGLLVSKDAGATFEWICEPAMGYGGVQDPGIAVMADGALLVSAFEGLAKSLDGGCNWSFEETAGLDKEYVIDVASDRVDPASAVVVTSTGTPDGTFNVEVFRTADNAKTWASVGPKLDADIIAETVDIAPNDPKTLYVSGEVGQGKDRKGVFVASHDGGKTWKRSEVELGSDVQLFIAAVDPTDKERVYLRTVGTQDRLIVTKDAGTSFNVALGVTRPMTGFGVSPDGATVVLGGPDVGWNGGKPAMTVERRPLLLAAPRDTLAFTEVGKKTSQCLHWSSLGLFACGEQNNDSYVVGRAPSAGGAFASLLPKLASIKGPLACPAESKVTKVCAPAWPALRAMLEGGTPGTGGAGGQGSGTAVAPGASAKETGCACTLGPGSLGGAASLAALAGLAIARRGRRR